MSVQERRRENLRKLADSYGLKPVWDSDSAAEEDLAAYFPDEEYHEADPDTIERWCSVRLSGEFVYLYPEHKTKRDAQLHSIESVTDTMHSEAPYKIVNLDNNNVYYPNWERLTWRPAK